MKYTTLLLDLDGTLLDFDKAEERDLEDILLQYVGRADEEAKAMYHAINSKVWKQLELGEITRQELYHIRFKQLLNALKIDCSDALSYQINNEYIDGLQAIWIEGAEQVCNILSNTHSLYLVTNGRVEVQQRKIDQMGLAKYITKAYISGDIGVEKPNKAFFDAVLSDIPEKDKRNILIIGDRLTSDIKGGNNAGIDTCWYNPKKKKKKEEVDITYEIQELAQLLEIV